MIKEMIKHLENLRNFNSTEQITNYIKKIYSNTENLYIPAILSEGDFINGIEADFYVKLVLKHKELPIDKTWLTSNLSFSFPTPQNIHNITPSQLNELFIHNVIVYKNYKNSSVYQVNPFFTVTEAYSENDIKQFKYVEAYFDEEYQNEKGSLVLNYQKEENSEYLGILKNFLAEFIIHDEQKYEHVYELVAEFEYRNKNHTKLLENQGNSNSICLECSYNEKYGLYLRGSMILPFSFSKTNARSIKVIDLGTGKVRDHNPNHYNGDIEEGFVVFSDEAINLLKQDYFFYDIEMIEKKQLDNSVLVDYLGERVVFWEAEYNKLPTLLKDKIDKYNIVPNDKSYISKAMFSMQLDVSINWVNDLEPDKKLAYAIKNHMFLRAIDMDLNFVYPQNEEELQIFINSIEKLTQITLEDFNSNAEDVKKLFKIRNNNRSSLSKVHLKNLYLKYCFAVYNKFKEKYEWI